MNNRILAGIATFCMALPLMGGPVDIIPVGPPVSGTNWFQTWNLSDFASADIRWLDVFVVSAVGTFSHPAVRNFTDLTGRWPTPLSNFALYAETTTAAFSGGTDFTDSVSLETHFSGSTSNPLTIELFAYNSADTFIHSFSFHWHPFEIRWSVHSTPNNPGTGHPVPGSLIPLPTGAAMAMVGMGLIGVRRRR